jgi:pyrroloquinoline quinone (PQQ) biosynthesis protein C
LTSQVLAPSEQLADLRHACTQTDFVGAFLTRLTRPADEVDAELAAPEILNELIARVADLGMARQAGDSEAFFAQQLLLSKIYSMIHLRIPDEATAEGSTVLHAVTRQLERDTMAAEDAVLDPAVLDSEPADPEAYVRWLKDVARAHAAFKHPYYHQFLREQADREDLRAYVVQESAIDSRFDDLLAMMQVGTVGAAKMEIAANFWDEMGNGTPEQVHTTLFSKILDEFAVSETELSDGLTAEALLSGNLAVLTARYRSLFGEAVGYLGMTEWLVPDRFAQVLRAWRRLDLPPAAIVYHELHIGIDAHHANGWFANVVRPAASNARMRRAVTRGALWRLNSSARYLDGNLERVR